MLVHRQILLVHQFVLRRHVLIRGKRLQRQLHIAIMVIS
jgi:hypothetical protein